MSDQKISVLVTETGIYELRMVALPTTTAHTTWQSDNIEGELEKLSLENVDSPHGETLRRAISNVLSCPIAEMTYALILDGLPTADVALDIYDSNVCPGHPLLKAHKELCPGVLERARELRASLDFSILHLDSKLFFAFQATPPGSRAFNTRLIELVAVAIHQATVWLYKTSPGGLHKDDELGLWRPTEKFAPYYRRGFPKTLFRHSFYRDDDLYPDGVAEVVGYWAEARIFGGVVLFDRREPDSAPDVDPSAVYMHPDRRDVIYRIFKLLDEQKRQLVEFLLTEDTAATPCPLPILPDGNNRTRVDPEDPLEGTGIYRAKGERREVPIEADRRFRDVIDTFNYLSPEDYNEAQDRAWDRKMKWYDRQQFGE